MLRTMVKARLRRARGQADDGMAMLMVIGTMVVITIIAVATLAFATTAIPQARHSEDYQIAGAAAQAGVDDFLGRLAVCNTYWQKPCANSAPDNTSDPYSVSNPSKWLDGVNWVNVPDTSSGVASSGQYTYKLLSANAGVLRIEVKGRSRGVTRVFTDDLHKSGLLNYIYYTDLEDEDPLLYYVDYPSTTYHTNDGSYYPQSGPCGTPYRGHYCTTYVMDNPSTTAQDLSSLRANCGVQTDGSNPQYWYNGRNNAQWQWYYTATKISTDSYGRTTTGAPYQGSTATGCSEIQFASGDTINGPLHTNDAMYINGGKFTNKDTETGWTTSAPVQPAQAGHWWTGSGPSSQGYAPVPSALTVLPPNNASIEQQADPAFGGQGCLYTGPTKITLLPSGKMQVTSPYTKSANSGCYTSLPMTSAQTVNTPANGVVYVQGIPSSPSDPNYSSSCSMSTVISSIGYPNTSDVQAQPTSSTVDGQFGCADGTAFVSGSGFGGKYTIATAKDIYVVGNTTYSNTGVGGDVLGLVANGFVYVYHPVNSSGSNLSGSLSNPVIDAAVLSVNDSFVVENWNNGAQLGTLTVFGGIYQRYRGPVGTGSGSCSGGTGYCKNYNYDNRLAFTDPPPYFLDPVSSAWRIANQAEQNAGNS